MTRPLSVLAALLLVALLLAGCGYSSGSLIPDTHRTIGVPVFDNTTRRRDLEWELTRAVVEELQARSHLRVVDPADGPDLLLQGRLVMVDEDVLSRRSRQRIRESSVRLGAEISVTEAATGSVVVDRRRVYERESFVPVKGEDVRTAREEGMRALAERIVRELETGW